MIKCDTNIEAYADYKRFKAIQHHEKALLAPGNDKHAETSKALKFYEEANEIANKNLNLAHPVVTQTALNFSSFQHYTLGSADKALATNTKAYQ